VTFKKRAIRLNVYPVHVYRLKMIAIMKKYRCLCTLLFAMTSCISGFSQTKLIAHKSHSGSEASFHSAYKNNFFDLGNSNFGNIPDRTVTTASLDSLIFISDTIAIMVTSEYCKRLRDPKREKTIWRAGKDTVYNHPLFTKKYSIEHIRNYLKQYYHFQNPVDSIKIIDQQQEEQQEYQTVPVASPGSNDDGPAGNHPYLWIGFIFLLSLIGSGLYHLLLRLQRVY
jgi:hypothetical protein